MKYNEMEVVSQLQKKVDIQINGNHILVTKGSSAKCDIGIKSKGKIDFLVNYCGYMLSFVSRT